MAKTLLFFVCCMAVFIHKTTAQYGLNTNGYGAYPNYNYGYGYGYGYPTYGTQQNPGYGYYPTTNGYYPNYGYQQAGYPYYNQNQNQLGYPNPYYGNGLNQAYASTQGGTATAQATSGVANGGGGYFG